MEVVFAQRGRGTEMAESGVPGAEPRIVRARGGWLALSKPGSVFRIGVVGSTEEEALQRFRESVEAWERLRRARLDGTS
jgi:hypothetical protein